MMKRSMMMSVWRRGGRFACDFMLCPGRQLGAGWDTILLPSVVKPEHLSVRANLFVSRFITRKLSLSALLSDSGIDRSVWAMVLLPPSRLQQFLRYLGAIYVAQEVRQAIQRSDVTAFRNALGEELYWFTLQRAPLIGQLEDSASQAWGAEAIAVAVSAAGRQALKQLCTGHPALWSRVMLKLPHVAEIDSIPYSVSTSIEQTRRIAMRVLWETETAWAYQFLRSMDSVL